MNREREPDQLLRAWLDEGAEVAPERFVWAALEGVERTAQRARWRISLEGIVMQTRRAAPILAVAAIAIAAVAAYIAIARPNVGNTPAPTPRAVTVEELPTLVLDAVSAPEGLFLDTTRTGVPALVAGLPSEGPEIDQTGFLDARQTQLSGPSAAVSTWAALFETAVDAEAGFAFYVARSEAPDGWGLEPVSGVAPLGDEFVAYRGAAYGLDETTTYLWRVNNVVLAVIGIQGTDEALVREIAGDMNRRAH